jgi:hypothetical protein
MGRKYRVATKIGVTFLHITNRCVYNKSWPTKSDLRCAYYGGNKAQIFNGAIDSANLKKSTLN